MTKKAIVLLILSTCGRREQPPVFVTYCSRQHLSPQPRLAYNSVLLQLSAGINDVLVPFSAREDLKLKLIHRTESADTTEV